MALIVLFIIAPDFVLNFALSVLNVVFNDPVLELNKEQPMQINDVSDIDEKYPVVVLIQTSMHLSIQVTASFLNSY